MKLKRVIFRADGDQIAGYGHVVRALSLASILKKRYRCVFIIREPDSFLKEQIQKVCDEIIDIPVQKTYEIESDFI
jgi:spore coat polysaccharide biosynthesis predicted glycosyltransferase SpsG